MTRYPSSGEIVTTHRGPLVVWRASQLAQLKAGSLRLVDVYREAHAEAKALVEIEFAEPPKLGPPMGKPENDTSNGTLIVGAVTAVFLLLASPFLGFISLLGIPAVLFWIFMAKVLREPADMPQQRAQHSHQQELAHWEKVKERTSETLAKDIKEAFNRDVAEEFGVPERLWPSFSEAMYSWQLASFNATRRQIEEWANQPKYPNAPVQIEEGVSHEESEAYCCLVMHHWGYMDAETTRYTQDGGVDIFSKDFVAQCKHVAGTVGAPDVQRIFGIAASKGKQALIFSAGSFSKAALKSADEAGVGAVVISEVNGTVRPQNAVAEEIIKRNSAGPR